MRTLSRLAAHLDRLAVGDEANAAIDAFDAVNLMTVHAAKGLEFPVVFVVNLARGSGNRRDPVRLTAGPAGHGGSVAVGDFQSDADDDHAAREREETKRLLYVALTRARDRLYLGTVLKEGSMQPGRGSLGEVLPLSLRERFVPAAFATEWRSSSGTVHPFRVCAPRPNIPEPAEAMGAEAFVEAAGAHLHAAVEVRRLNGDRPADDFAPLTDTTPRPRTVASALAEASGGASIGLGTLEDGSDRVVGTLVHRMLERFGFERDGGCRITRESVLPLLDSHDLFDTTAVGADDLADAALHSYRAICGRPEIAALYLAGDRWHEVPFSMRRGDSVWRGTIDCLIRMSPTAMAVLEFKTGRRRPEHHVQLELYREAASRLFPGMAVEAHLVYPGDPLSV